MSDRPVTSAAARTAASDEKARRGLKEVRLQLAPETAKTFEATADQVGRQGFSDALNAILERYDAGR